MQTVGELVAELQKLPQDDLVDIKITHSFQFLHSPKPEVAASLEAKSE